MSNAQRNPPQMQIVQCYRDPVMVVGSPAAYDAGHRDILASEAELIDDASARRIAAAKRSNALGHYDDDSRLTDAVLDRVGTDMNALTDSASYRDECDGGLE